MITPEMVERINREFHTDRCVCQGTFDERCKALREVPPVGVSGNGRMAVEHLVGSEVPTGETARETKWAAREAVAATRRK